MIGIVANSDGRSDAVSAAVDVFHASGAEVLIHCGDVGGRHVLDAMSAFGTSMFVWGDRDKDRMGLMRYAHSRSENRKTCVQAHTLPIGNRRPALDGQKRPKGAVSRALRRSISRLLSSCRL